MSPSRANHATAEFINNSRGVSLDTDIFPPENGVQTSLASAQPLRERHKSTRNSFLGVLPRKFCRIGRNVRRLAQPSSEAHLGLFTDIDEVSDHVIASALQVCEDFGGIADHPRTAVLE